MSLSKRIVTKILLTCRAGINRKIYLVKFYGGYHSFYAFLYRALFKRPTPFYLIIIEDKLKHAIKIFKDEYS